MEKKQITVGDIQLTLFVLDDGRWALTDDMTAAALGISVNTVRRHLMRNKDVLLKGHHWIELNRRYWTKEGLIKLGDYVKQKKAGVLLDALGVRSRHVTRIESDVVGIVSASLTGIAQIQLQHPVEGYKVDIYLPSIKLAVEIDERSHESYEPFGEVVREFVISKKLGCEFIRWDAHAPGANVGTLINKILHRIIAFRATGNEA